MKSAHRGDNLRLKAAFFALFGTMCGLNMQTAAQAEETLIYSYMRTSPSNDSYMLLPQTADVASADPRQIFDCLRRRKLPTYGATSFDETSGAVVIDETKCGYSAIISAEISESFAYHGFKLPKFTCGTSRILSGYGQLPHYVAVLPLWQALAANAEASPASLVQVGEEYLSLKVFRERAQKRDKSVVAAMEADLIGGDGFVRSGIMRGMLAYGFPGAEKRIIKLLESPDPVTVNAALEALLTLGEAKLGASAADAMRRVIEQPSPHQIQRASAALSSPSKSLRFCAMSVLFQSAGEASFNMAHAAYAALNRSEAAEFWRLHGEDILSGAKSANIGIIAEAMHGAGQDGALAAWLWKSPATANAVAAAQRSAEIGSGSLLEAALAVLIESDGDIEPYDAWDRLAALSPQQNVSPRAAARGLRSRSGVIRLAAYRALETSQASCGEFAEAISDGDNARAASVYAPMTASWLGTHCSAAESEKIALPALRARAQAAAGALPAGDFKISAALLSLARTDPGHAPETFAKYMYAQDPATRRDIAYGLRWIGESGDSLRAALLKDGDESVAENVLLSMAGMTPERLTPAMAKEIFSRAKQSDALRIVALTVLAGLAGEKNGQIVTASIANEMFDDNIVVKIAAIRALTEIAKHNSNPILRENAVSSLSLTAQDASPAVVFHTLRGLKAANAPDADRLLAIAKKTHPDVFRRLARDQ